jgi:hypothetical protein
MGTQPAGDYSSNPQQTSALRFSSGSTSYALSDVNSLALNDLRSNRGVKERREIRPLKPVGSEWTVGNGDMKLSLPPLNVSLS